MILYPIEGVYQREPLDISIIIPMYKSKAVIADQIRRWPTTDKGLRVELVYVDDGCPQHSSQSVFKCWNKRRDRSDFTVRLIVNKRNTGFGMACNKGAFHAYGKYLVFLNADTVPYPNWLYPIFELFESDPSVGIVGNLQLKEGGEWHGTIDGAGSEWYWPDTNFIHIGRHILDGKPLERPLKPDEFPSGVAERDMVTGCCLAIRKSLFDNLGGFNQCYRIGYWEDSDLCMSVKDKGFKIVFQPESVVWHKLSHSKVGQHRFQESNKLRFINKWVATGRFDKMISSPRPIRLSDPNLILVKRDAANGDVLLAAGVASAIKKRYPSSTIHFTTTCPDVLQNNPYLTVVDQAFVLNNAHRYQWIVDLNLCYERRPKIHILQAYADEAGVPVADMDFFFRTDKPPLELPENYVVMHADMTNWIGRNWLSKRFSEIAQRFLDRGERLILIGGQRDLDIPCTLDLRLNTTLYETAYIIQRAKLFVGIDSLPMHIAQVLDTPGVCFFGCIDPQLRIFRHNMTSVTAKIPCVGCHHEQFPPVVSLEKCSVGDLGCEYGVSSDMMWERIEEHLWNKNT